MRIWIPTNDTTDYESFRAVAFLYREEDGYSYVYKSGNVTLFTNQGTIAESIERDVEQGRLRELTKIETKEKPKYYLLRKRIPGNFPREYYAFGEETTPDVNRAYRYETEDAAGYARSRMSYVEYDIVPVPSYEPEKFTKKGKEPLYFVLRTTGYSGDEFGNRRREHLQDRNNSFTTRFSKAERFFSRFSAEQLKERLNDGVPHPRNVVVVPVYEGEPKE